MFYLFIAALAGIVLGILLTNIAYRFRPESGVMIFNLNDPSKDLFELRFTEDLDDMIDHGQVIFKVVTLEKPIKK